MEQRPRETWEEDEDSTLREGRTRRSPWLRAEDEGKLREMLLRFPEKESSPDGVPWEKAPPPPALSKDRMTPQYPLELGVRSERLVGEVGPQELRLV